MREGVFKVDGLFGYMDGPWRNDACMGYSLMAMQRAGLDEGTIRKVLGELYWCFDDTSVEDAAKYLAGGGK